MKTIYFFFTFLLFTISAKAQDALIFKLPAGKAPLIDGSVDNLWDTIGKQNIDKIMIDQYPTIDSAWWKAVWNDTALFILPILQLVCLKRNR